MTKPKSLQVPDEQLEYIHNIFLRHVNGETIPQIAKSLGLSVNKTNIYLGQAREAVYNDLMTYGKKEMATIYARYSFIYDQAKAEWDISKNPKFLSEMRAALAEQKRMLGLDAAPKMAVSENTGPADDQLIFLMNDENYKKREAELEKERETVIDATPLNTEDE